MSIIHKAGAVEVDGLEFVLSDATPDSYGDVVEAAGWDLKRFKQNPIALFGHSSGFPIGKWRDVRVEDGKLKGRLEFAAEGTSQRIDELRRLVEQGILRAVSVGFRPIEYQPIDEKSPGRGYRYTKQELMETSLVSVPANPASLAIAKSLHVSDDTLDLAFGEQAEMGGIKRRGATGEHAATPTHPIRRKDMTTLSQRIENAQKELNHFREKLAHLNEQDALDLDAIEALHGEIDEKSRHLGIMKASESRMGSTEVRSVASLVAPVTTPAIVRRPLGVKGKEPEPRDLLIRAAAVQAISHVTGKSVDHVLETRYGDHEATHLVTRAAVSGATTTAAGWAAELVNTATADFLDSLSGQAIYPRLVTSGDRLTFNNQQGAIKIPSEAATPTISGSFVGEGQPIPVRKMGIGTITLTPKKMGVISVFSREIAMYSTPAIEGLIRQRIQTDTERTIDSLLLDAVAGSTVRPAGLLNGVAPIAATAGGGSGAIIGDIAALAAPFDTANAGRDLVLLMNRGEARRLAMTPGPDGIFGWADRFMGEFRVIVSNNVPAGQIIMIDAADLVSAAGDTPVFDVSDQTVLHMEDTTPLQIGVAGTPNAVAAPVQSMFQTAQIAIRMLLDITWAMRRGGMVQTITGVTW